MNIEEEKIEALKFLTNRYAENVWKHTSVHLVALGWVLSSQQIHNLIKDQLVIQIVLTFIFVALEAIHWFVNEPLYRRIRSLEKEVENSFNQELANAYTVKPSRFAWNEFMVLSLAVIAVIFVWLYPCL